MKIQARYKINELLTLVEPNSLGKEGIIKVSSNTSLEHLETIVRVAYMLKKEGCIFYHEAKFKDNKGRCDLLAFSSKGDGFIIEILKSETEKMFDEKLKKYPIELEIVKINSKTFKKADLFFI